MNRDQGHHARDRHLAAYGEPPQATQRRNGDWGDARGAARGHAAADQRDDGAEPGPWGTRASPEYARFAAGGSPGNGVPQGSAAGPRGGGGSHSGQHSGHVGHAAGALDSPSEGEGYNYEDEDDDSDSPRYGRSDQEPPSSQFYATAGASHLQRHYKRL